jgi:RimJ/RimL family protein N-acetyltransferase
VDPEVVRFMPWGPNTEAETAAFVGRCIAARAEAPRRIFELGIARRATGELIGGCGLRVIRPDAAEGEIGYVLRRDCWGQGLMGEAVAALLGYGFGTLALHRISATTDPQNIASARVLEKCGFRLEGCLRDHTRVRGQWRHSLVYGLLEPEWRAATGGAPAAPPPAP